MYTGAIEMAKNAYRGASLIVSLPLGVSRDIVIGGAQLITYFPKTSVVTAVVLELSTFMLNLRTNCSREMVSQQRRHFLRF